MDKLIYITPTGHEKEGWTVECWLDLETGRSLEVVGQRAIQWGEKQEGDVLEQQFAQLQAMSPLQRERYIEFLESIEQLPKTQFDTIGWQSGS